MCKATIWEILRSFRVKGELKSQGLPVSQDLYDTDDDEPPRLLGIKLPLRTRPRGSQASLHVVWKSLALAG